MPIDLYSSIKKTSQWAFGSPVLNNILGSSLFVAITIALLMIVLLMIMYPAKSGTPFSVVIKMFIYMLFGSMLIIFLHDGVIKYMFDEEQESEKASSFMQNTTMEGRRYDPAYGSTYRSINPEPMTVVQPTPPVAQVQPIMQPVAPVIGGGISEFYNVVEGGGGRLYGAKPPPIRQNLFAK